MTKQRSYNSCFLSSYLYCLNLHLATNNIRPNLFIQIIIKFKFKKKSIKFINTINNDYITYIYMLKKKKK
jgi:hypothetical protein